MPDEDQLFRCPQCDQYALRGIYAAEVPGPLLYVCGDCFSEVQVLDYLVNQVAQPPADEKPKSLLNKIRGVLHV